MSTVQEGIMEHANRLPEGAVVAPKSFLHLGSRAAVDQALSRMARGGELLRVSRGRYSTSTTNPVRAAGTISARAGGATLTGQR